MIYADLGSVLTNLRKADICRQAKDEACRNYGAELSTGWDKKCYRYTKEILQEGFLPL